MSTKIVFLQNLGGQLQTCSACVHVKVNSTAYSFVSVQEVIEICERGWFAIVKKKQKMNSQQLRLSRAVDLP